MVDEETSPQPRKITGVSSIRLPLPISSAQGTVWSNYLFAPEWFADATGEVSKTGAQARRREIVFAVAAAESYLFEWVLDDVLKLTSARFEQINTYFDPENPKRILARFIAVTQKLREHGKLQNCPNFSDGNPIWVEFRRLIDFRNGLVHGKSSRPQATGQDPKKEPYPSKKDLDHLPPGWAVGAVVAVIGELHKAAGTVPPSWLVKP